MRGTSWSNLRMLMAVIPDMDSDIDDDDSKSKRNNKKSNVQISLEEAGF